MLTQPQPQQMWDEPKPTALLVLADGTVLEGRVLAPPAMPSARSASIPR